MNIDIESNQSTDEFDQFVAAGEVEVGDSNKADEDDGKAKKGGGSGGPPRERKAPATNTDDDQADDGDDDEDAGDGDDDNEDEDGEQKPKKSAKDHQIERLKREKRDLQRQLRDGGVNTAISQRLENIESRLTDGKGGDNKTAGKPAPDPSDTAKYPLGHLDDRYIEDKLEWLADRKAAEQADSVLQRQQENERDSVIRQHQVELLDKVDDLSAKGSELYDDFQEEVVEAGMRGDWKCQQATFEACHEVDNGAQILYELSQNPKEALRVSRLSPFQQMKFVQERDAEIGVTKKGRTKPKAGEPPKNLPRGANSKNQINPATDNLDDFAKAWDQDAKKNG